MQIKRSIVLDGNVEPKPTYYLQELPADIVFNENYDRMPHPSKIYNKSLRDVAEAINKVLEIKKQIETPPTFNPENKYFDELPDAQSNLLLKILTHIDNCYRVLKSTHPPEIIPDIKNANRTTSHINWLSSAKHPTFKTFQNEVNKYRNQISRMYKEAQHGDAKFGICAFYPLRDKGYISGISLETGLSTKLKKGIVGYYLETYSKSHKSHGPDEEFHQFDTAISLNRDLVFHVYHIYRIGEILINAIIDAAKISKDISLPRNVKSEKISGLFLEHKILEEISNAPSFFFPNEIGAPNPYIYFTKGKRGEKVEMGISDIQHYFWNDGCQYAASIIVEGETMKLPSFKNYPRLNNKLLRRYKSFSKGGGRNRFIAKK